MPDLSGAQVVGEVPEVSEIEREATADERFQALRGLEPDAARCAAVRSRRRLRSALSFCLCALPPPLRAEHVLVLTVYVLS